MPTRLVIFDLDGTLIDSLQDIASSVDAVLREAGLPTHGVDAYRAMVGDGLPKLVERALPPGADFARLLAATRERYGAHCMDQTRAYPGIEALLAALTRRALPLAVLSNKPDELTQTIVRWAFAPETFSVVIGDREGVPKKPDPTSALEIARRLRVDPAATMLVGDTPIDLTTARAAGMRSVAVTWGFRSVAQLREAEPDAIIDAPAQLLGLLPGG